MRKHTKKYLADFAELTSPPVLYVNNPFALVSQNTNTNIKEDINKNCNIYTNIDMNITTNDNTHTEIHS